MFIPLPADRNQGCFQVVFTLNKAAINIHVQTCLDAFFSFLWDKLLGVGLLGYMVGVRWTSQKAAKLSSKVVLPFYAPITSDESTRSVVPHPFQHLVLSVSKTFLKSGLLTYELHIVKFTAFSDEFREFWKMHIAMYPSPQAPDSHSSDFYLFTFCLFQNVI